jgi:hypothetical protein
MTSPSRPEAAGLAAEIERAAKLKQGSPFLRTYEAARYFGLSENCLAKMRCRGVGPPYHKHGRYVRYHVDDVVAWSNARARTGTGSRGRDRHD